MTQKSRHPEGDGFPVAMRHSERLLPSNIGLATQFPIITANLLLALLPNRKAGEDTVDALVDQLDAIDGDPDAEPNGDELNGSGSEDEFHPAHYSFDGPGCPAADPEEYAYPEWHTRERHKATEFTTSLPNQDAEDDDGGGDCTDHEPGFHRTWRQEANALGGFAGVGAGCAITGDAEPNGDEGDYSAGVAE